MTDFVLFLYLGMIPIATMLILWDWARRGVEPDFAGAMVMAIWWPVVFFAVLSDVFDED